MKLVTLSDDRGVRVGILSENGAAIVDLAVAAPLLPRQMLQLIAAGPDAVAQARKVAVSGMGRLAASTVKLHAPIPLPARNIYCVGKNYREHATGDLIATGTCAGVGIGFKTPKFLKPGDMNISVD